MTFLCGWMLWMCLLCVACALVLLVGMAQLRHVLSLTAPWLLRTDAHPLRVALFNPFHRKTTAACAWFIGFLDAFAFGPSVGATVLVLSYVMCSVCIAPREYGTSGRCWQ